MNSLISFLSRVFNPNPTRRCRTKRRIKRRFASSVSCWVFDRTEILESRLLLTSYVWIGDSGGSWGNPNNWVDPQFQNGVPDSPDDGARLDLVGDLVRLGGNYEIFNLLTTSSSHHLFVDLGSSLAGLELIVGGNQANLVLQGTVPMPGTPIDGTFDFANVGIVRGDGELTLDNFRLNLTDGLSLAKEDAQGKPNSGKLYLNNVSELTTGNLRIGRDDNINGPATTVEVNGGSILTSTDQTLGIVIGEGGRPGSSLTVSNGEVHAERLVVGQKGAASKLVVTGEFSSVQANHIEVTTDMLPFGWGGDSKIEVLSGGSVTGNDIQIGIANAVSSTVNVSGAGSSLHSNGWLKVSENPTAGVLVLQALS